MMRAAVLVALIAVAASIPAAAGRTQDRRPLVPPALDTSRHSVPLRAIAFDTFDGRFVRLTDAGPALVRRLRDAIKPVHEPGYGPAPAWLEDDDLVLGYEAAGKAFAYPIGVLNRRELVNDVIGGEPILVSYCPLCGSGVVYSRRAAGRTLHFGNTSALYESDLVMFDYETGSYWFQVRGEAIVGPLTGTRLRPLPSATLPWAEWRRLHPETQVLVGDGTQRFDATYGLDPYRGYASGIDRGEFPFPVSQAKLDGRLRMSEIVLAVRAGRRVRAYPLGVLVDAVVNDVVDGEPVLVVGREGFFGAVFRASWNGRRLTFVRRGARLVDHQTGSAWDDAGRALSGPLAGARLKALPVRRAFWFSIATAFPDADPYRVDPLANYVPKVTPPPTRRRSLGIPVGPPWS